MALQYLHQTILTSGATWDVSLYKFAYLQASGNTTLTATLSNPDGGMLLFQQDATGSRTLTINGQSVQVNTSANSYTEVNAVKINNIERFWTAVGSSSGGSSGDVTSPAVVGNAVAYISSGSFIDITYNETLQTKAATASGHGFTCSKAIATASASGTKVTLALSAAITEGESITLSYDGSGFVKDTAGNSAAAATITVTNNGSTLVFTSVSGLTNSGGIWSPTTPGGTAYGNQGLANSVAFGTPYRISCSGASVFANFGFASTNALTGFASMVAGFIIAAGGIYKNNGGTVGSQFATVTTGNRYGLYVDGTGNMKIQVSSDGGATWADVAGGGLTSTVSGTVYIVCDVRGDGHLDNPKASAA